MTTKTDFNINALVNVMKDAGLDARIEVEPDEGKDHHYLGGIAINTGERTEASVFTTAAAVFPLLKERFNIDMGDPTKVPKCNLYLGSHVKGVDGPNSLSCSWSLYEHGCQLEFHVNVAK